MLFLHFCIPTFLQSNLGFYGSLLLYILFSLPDCGGVTSSICVNSSPFSVESEADSVTDLTLL